jgi:stage V sporulation protein G
VEITEVRIKLMDANGDKLRAFCSITIDNDFVIRDLKVIEGLKGPFVAMPSRKLTERCRRCTGKNHYRAKYCNECGRELSPERSSLESHGRQKLHADIAHPINQRCREAVQARILEEYQKELERKALDPGNYKPVELDVFDLDLIGEEVAAPTDADEFEPEHSGAGAANLDEGGFRDDLEPDAGEIDRAPPVGAGFRDRDPEPGWRRGGGSFGPPAGPRFSSARGEGEGAHRQGRDRPRSGDGGGGGRGGFSHGRQRTERRDGPRDRRPRGGNWRGPGEGRRRDDGFRAGGGSSQGRRPRSDDRRGGYPRGRPESAESAPPGRELEESPRAPIFVAESNPVELRKPPEAPRPAPVHDDPPEDNFGVGLIS